MAKLTVLIFKNATNVVSIQKLLLDFLLEMEKSETLDFGFCWLDRFIVMEMTTSEV